MKRFASLLLVVLLCLMPLTSALAAHDYAGLDEVTIMRRGDQGENVKRLQKALISLGYLQGKADGLYGEDTALAVGAFQMKNGFGGVPGFFGVATLFTQAALYGDQPVPSSTENGIGNVAEGPYGLRSVSVSMLGDMSSTFKFTNESDDPVEAVCVIYWMADKNDRVVNIDGKSFVKQVVYGLNLPRDGTISIVTKIPATQKEIDRASSLRFIISEIAYTGGSVYVDYNAALSPYENDYFVAAKWNQD
ncbi:MAG: peptidoglycan-binding protein [Clostridia bacterium]|nr:peptidoglycan-binding protein [Clostridia bacterium]